MNSIRENRNILTYEIKVVLKEKRELPSRSFFWTVMTVIALTGIISIASVSSLFTNAVIIKSKGEISTKYIIARSGSPEDIQAAVNAVNAAGGGTVYLPEGTFHWNGETVTIPGGVNVIGAGPAGCDGYPNFNVYSAKTILHNDKRPPANRMFYIDGSNGKPTRISGIQFEIEAPSNLEDEDRGADAIEALRCINLRVDHCTFINFCGTAVFVGNSNSGTASGVIDHCVIDNPYKLSGSDWTWGYGFYVGGRAYYWNDQTAPITNFLGKYEDIPEGYPVLYVEDCKISRCRHAVDGIQGGWMVARYNYIDHPYPTNFGQLEVHGSGDGAWPSARGFEFYNNIVVGETDMYTELTWLRGGGGVVFNNSFSMSSGYAIGLYRENCPQQPDEILHNVWIWNNIVNGGTLILNAGGFTENVDYFLYAKSGYTPYPYPHLLALK